MRIIFVAVCFIFLVAGVAVLLGALEPSSFDDADVSNDGFHRVKIGEIELHVPSTVTFQVPGENLIRPGDPLFSGSISDHYVAFTLDQILKGSSWGGWVHIGGLKNPAKVDLYCKYYYELETNTNRWHRRVDPDGVVIYTRKIENKPDLRPEDRGDYLLLPSTILNRPIFLSTGNLRLTVRPGEDLGYSYRLRLALTSNVGLEISFWDAQIPRPTWPEAFATIDKTLSKWIQRSDASDSGQPQSFEVDECKR